MLKAIKFRIYPTIEQKTLIHKHFGCARVVYNYFLAYRQKQYAQGIRENYFSMQKALTTLKKQEAYAYLSECNSQSLQMALRQLTTAFDRFFSKLADYPRFKSKKHAKQSFCVPQHLEMDLGNNQVKLPKFKEAIKAKFHRHLPTNSIVKQGFISCVADKYYLSISYEDNEPEPKPTTIKKAVGLDMGLESLVIASSGVLYPYKKFFQNLQTKLTKAQRRLSKKLKGSSNRKKQAKKVAQIHASIRNSREDYLHKISNEITNQYDLIAVETLKVRNLVKNHKLAKSIANASWSRLISLLEYKAGWKGKTLIKIDQYFPSSQICSTCGSNTGKKPLPIRNFICPCCQTYHHRDLNASINIRNYALGMLDERHAIKVDKTRVGITRSYACGDSANGAVTKYGYILDTASYGSLKQEAHPSLAGG
ncbi:IS605 transposase TnpB (plasmid) [Helicobacter sp. NHP19-003]|uniref:IS605 transposase TnpB n=2 Tax=Helicobacter gastrocanis TaxID=2849641 RepID=A0ABM7SHD1_9HELI|nr:RNA-guided endonuclease TnpB family protein [Helicobacter sp. NHP19-003]BCZ16863.1 IS605 transposase TnpB [Helicobacter sp. NHP19-003]BCZ17132.1 IS605 transposase TnpB [Helicobacter sp. NHP19-003]BCZ18049.1 IS605 transposase TnpB [Helicobacter sp. NHP19-003]BCZ18318.1 IS605 transposase TnpB [Helicobacter sp. NHP19-003]